MKDMRQNGSLVHQGSGRRASTKGIRTTDHVHLHVWHLLLHFCLDIRNLLANTLRAHRRNQILSRIVAMTLELFDELIGGDMSLWVSSGFLVHVQLPLIRLAGNLDGRDGCLACFQDFVFELQREVLMQAATSSAMNSRRL